MGEKRQFLFACLRWKIVKDMAMQMEGTKGAAEYSGDKISERGIFLSKQVVHSLKEIDIIYMEGRRRREYP